MVDRDDLRPDATPASPPRRAVLLAAGSGERLRPETTDRPKAMVEVAGRPLIAYALSALEACGVRRVAVVTGHAREPIARFLAEWRSELHVEERFSSRFAETNNVVSLACAADFLIEGAWIVETDVIAELAAWRLLAVAGAGEARWLAARFGAEHDGALLVADRSSRLREWLLRASAGAPVPEGAFKSMGILTVEASYGARLAAWLAIASAAGRDRIYYDQVLAEHLDDSDVRVVDAGATRWAEIDDLGDLARARRLFADAGATA